MDLTLIEAIVTRLGIPLTICIVFIWIVVDLYKWGKGVATAHIMKQTVTLEKVKHCSERTVGILEELHEWDQKIYEELIDISARIK